MRKKTYLTPYFLALFCFQLNAGVIKGRWEKADALASGTLITVSMKSGEVLSAAFKASGPSALTLLAGEQEKTLPKTEIQKIIIQGRKADPSWDGLLLGGAIGAGTLAAVCAIPGDDQFLSRAQTAAIGAILGGAVGSVVGFAADKMHKAPEVVYQAP